MSNNILKDSILDYVREFAIKSNNVEQFRRSIEEEYSQEIGQKIVLMLGRAPRYILNGENYSIYSVKIKIGNDLIDLAPSLSKEEMNFIFNLPYKASDE